MKLYHMLLVGGAALALALGAKADPDHFKYDRCDLRFGFGLEDRHKDAHKEAVNKDEKNHDENKGHPKRIGEAHDRIRARLADDHARLQARSDELKKQRRN
jgi:hypothetical protein